MTRRPMARPLRRDEIAALFPWKEAPVVLPKKLWWKSESWKVVAGALLVGALMWATMSGIALL